MPVYPEALSPDALTTLAARDRMALIETLRAHDLPLARLLEQLVTRHADLLAAAPEQLALQLRARLPRNEHTQAWIDDAARVERATGLALRSRTLAGPDRPELWSRTHHSALVHAIVVLPDGDTVVTAGEDGQLLRWSLFHGGQRPVALAGHMGPVNHLALSADGEWMLSAGDDHAVGLWHVRDGGDLAQPRKLTGHSHYVRQVAFAPGLAVSASQDGTARVWSVPEGRFVRALEHGQDVMSLAVSPDGALLATTTINSALHLWDLRTGEKLGQLYGNDEQVMRVMPGIFLGGTNNTGVGHKDYPHALGFLPDGSLWSMGAEWIVWDLEQRTERVRQPQLTRFSAQAVCWLDDERVAIGDYGVVRVRVRKGREWIPQEVLGTLGVGLEQCTALALGPDKRTLLSGHRKGEVYAWDLAVDPRTLPEAAHGGPVWEIQGSPSGRYAVSKAGDDSVCVWDTEAPAVPRVDRTRLMDPNSYGHWVAFARDESRLALADGKGTIQVRRLPEGGEAARVKLESEQNYQAVSALGFGADPRVIFAGLGGGGLYRVTLAERGAGGDDVVTEARTEKCRGYAHSPAKLWFSPDERTLVTEDNFAPSEKEGDWRDNVYQLLGWDVGTLERQWRVSAQKGAEREYVSFGESTQVPEGLLALDGSRQPKLVLRDPTRGAITRTFALPLRYFSGFARLADGRWFMLVQSVKDGPSRPTVFDPAGDRVVLERADPPGWNTRAPSPDGRLAVRTFDAALEVYDLHTGAVRARFFADNALSAARFSRDGARLLVGDRAGMVHVLDVGTLPAEVAAAAPWPMVPPPVKNASGEASEQAGEASPRTPRARAKKRAAKKGVKKGGTTKRAAKKRVVAKKKPAVKKAAKKKPTVKKAGAKRKPAVKKRAVTKGAKRTARPKRGR